LYVPITEDEQEVLQRIVDSQTLRITVYPWKIMVIPTWVGVGDKRLALKFEIPFTEVTKPTVVRSMDLELTAYTGVKLIRKPYPTFLSDGTPLVVDSDLILSLQWDVAIDHLDPALVKMVKPGTLGLTSRRLDPVTGARTLMGNMRYKDGERRGLLRFLEEGERKVQELSLQDLKKAESRKD